MKKWCRIIILAVVLTGAAVRIIWLNLPQNAMQPYFTYLEMGEEFDVGDFTFCVDAYEILNSDEMYEKYGIRDKDIDADDIYYLLTDISIIYNGEQEEMECSEIIHFIFQSGAWNNGQEYFTVMEINKDGIRVKSGETVTFHCVTHIRRNHFPQSDWKTVKERLYEVVCIDYPKVMVIPLK